MNLDETLAERQSAYGSFFNRAVIAQSIKHVMQNYTNWESLPDDMKQALEEIVGKVSRILNGDFSHVDSWKDIAGYAMLVVDELELSKECEQTDLEEQANQILDDAGDEMVRLDSKVEVRKRG